MLRGPVLTLIAVLVLGVGLLAVDSAFSIPTPDAIPTPAPASLTSAAPAAAPAPQGSATPAATAFPATARYSGRATPSSTPVTIWVEGDRARIYVCDNADIEAWLRGSARDGVIDATGKDGSYLQGRYAAGAVTGRVQIPGHPPWTFTARPH